MISYLKGLLIGKTRDTATVLVNDAIGYDVRMNPLELALQVVQTPIALHCYHHITDRSQELYGFLTPEIKAIFTMLIENIAGIGPKSALKIIAKIDTAALHQALATGSADALEALGVGRKTAEKIIAGLKGKVAAPFNAAAAVKRFEPHGEVVDALVSLGYSKNEAEAALSQVNIEGKTSEKIIKETLKRL